MQVKQAKFLISNSDYTKCPKPDKPEVAFIGRSNVGKYSLINMLTNNARLAKISGKPGKTQLINHFVINNQWYLVDLPGYGWAKVSKQDRKKWEQMNRNYLSKRENLMCVMVLIDGRLDPQAIDLEFLKWLGQEGVPFVLVFTKADKLTPNALQSNIAKFRKAFLVDWEEMPQYFVSSAVSKKGKDDILNFLGTLLDTPMQ